MGRPAGWMKELTGRSAMKSPGKPSHRREVERLRFVWGVDAKVPSFNPLSVLNPVGMPLLAWEFYILALMVGIPGLVCLALARRRPTAPRAQ